MSIKVSLQLKRPNELALLANKRQTPREDIHEVGQPVGMRAAVELPNVHDIVLVF